MTLQGIHFPAFSNQDRGPISGVYFIRRGDSGPIKIGFSANVRKRIRSLQTGSAEPLKLLAVAEGGEQTERFLHEKFARHRLEGEWFSPDASLLALISDLTGKAASDRPYFVSLAKLPNELCHVLGIAKTTDYEAILHEVWYRTGPVQEAHELTEQRYAALRVRLAEMAGVSCEADDEEIVSAIALRLSREEQLRLALHEVFGQKKSLADKIASLAKEAAE